MNYSNINLNKSYEKFSSKQLNNNSSSKSNISRKTVQNYISSKKKYDYQSEIYYLLYKDFIFILVIPK